MPPRLRPRWRQGPSVLLGLLATAAIPAAFTGPPGLRLAIIGPLVLAGPGGAAALWLAHGARRQPSPPPWCTATSGTPPPACASWPA